jgi:DNA primase
VQYIEVTLSDIETANRLAHEVLGRTLDELPPQTRRLLHLIHEMVIAQCRHHDMTQADYRFSRREVREATGWGNTQLKVHLQRLVELEYLLIHRAGHAQRHLYELLYDGEPSASETHLNGLIEVARLRDGCAYDANRSEQKANRSASGRPAVGAQSAGGRARKNGAKPNGDEGLPAVDNDAPETALIRLDKNSASYRSDTPALLAKGVE